MPATEAPAADDAAPPGSDEAAIRAAWTRARELSDRQEFDRALSVVDEALQSHPGNLDLLWLRAGIVGWQGQHERAAALYRELIASHPERADALRADLAREEEAARARPPHVETSLSWRNDSDDARYIISGATWYRPLSRRDLLLVFVGHDEIRDPVSRHRFDRVGLGYERDWTPRIASHVLVHVGTQKEEAVPRVMGDAFVVWRPAPRVRYDLGVSRDIFQSARALDRGLRVWVIAAGTDHGLGRRNEIRLAARALLVNDGNTLHRQSAEYRYAAKDSGRVRATLLLRAAGLESVRRYDHGYYDPRAYGEFGPGLEAAWEPRPAWRTDLRVEIGVQKEAGTAAELFNSVSLGTEVPLARWVSLGVRLFRGDSNLSSDRGYEQHGWSLSLITGR